MTAEELEGARAFVEKWRIAGPMLEQVKIEELRAMTEEEGRQIAERLIEAVPVPSDLPTPEPTSGLVEQQRLFSKLRKC